MTRKHILLPFQNESNKQQSSNREESTEVVFPVQGTTHETMWWTQNLPARALVNESQSEVSEVIWVRANELPGQGQKL